MQRSLALLALFWALPVLALAPPMSLEDREAAASHVVDAYVMTVECIAPPERAENGAMESYYKAYLEVNAIHKGPDDLLVGDSMELLFSRLDYGDLPAPSCGWSASYREGQSGRWWLRDLEDGNLTMVSWNSFEADGNNAPLDLPVCDENSGDRLPWVDGGPGQSDAGSGGGISAPDGGSGGHIPDMGSPAIDAGNLEVADAGSSPDSGDAELCPRADGTRGPCLGENVRGCGCSGTGAEFGLLPLLFLAVRRRRSRLAS